MTGGGHREPRLTLREWLRYRRRLSRLLAGNERGGCKISSARYAELKMQARKEARQDDE